MCGVDQLQQRAPGIGVGDHNPGFDLFTSLEHNSIGGAIFDANFHDLDTGANLDSSFFGCCGHRLG